MMNDDKLEIEILDDPKEKVQWKLSQINPDLNPQNDRWIISFGTKDPREYLEFTGENNVMQLRSFYQSEKFPVKGILPPKSISSRMSQISQ